MQSVYQRKERMIGSVYWLTLAGEGSVFLRENHTSTPMPSLATKQDKGCFGISSMEVWTINITGGGSVREHFMPIITTLPQSEDQDKLLKAHSNSALCVLLQIIARCVPTPCNTLLPQVPYVRQCDS